MCNNDIVSWMNIMNMLHQVINIISFPWHWIISHTHNNIRTRLVLRLCVVFFDCWCMIEFKWWKLSCGTGDCQYLPKFELWTLYFSLTCLNHVNDKARTDCRVTKGSLSERASGTTETVTVKQLVQVILNCEMEMSSFFGPKLNKAKRPHAIVFILCLLMSGHPSIPMAMAI